MPYSIALDGPAGTGKTTMAKLIADKLGFLYVDTGAMYRALAVYFLSSGTDTGDEKAMEEALRDVTVEIKHENGEQRVYVNGDDVTARLRTEEVSKMASVTSQYAAVRGKLLDLQRSLAIDNDVIMDGRDIGTVVLPNATIKFFLTAKPEVRALRRYNQLVEQGKLSGATLETIEAEIRERDYRDSHRKNAPLIKADDAIEVDTSELSLEEEINQIISLISERIN